MPSLKIIYYTYFTYLFTALSENLLLMFYSNFYVHTYIHGGIFLIIVFRGPTGGWNAPQTWISLCLKTEVNIFLISNEFHSNKTEKEILLAAEGKHYTLRAERVIYALSRIKFHLFIQIKRKKLQNINYKICRQCRRSMFFYKLIITSWTKLPLEKLTVFQLVKNFTVLIGHTFHCRVHDNPMLDPIVSHLNPVHEQTISRHILC